MSFGLAQNRERVYLIGVRQNASGLKRADPKVLKPKGVKKPKLKDFLRPLSAPSKKLSKGGKANVEWARKKLQSEGVHVPDDDDAVVDACAGKRFRQVTIGRCPTITRGRGASRGFFLLKEKRLLGFQMSSFRWLGFKVLSSPLKPFSKRVDQE